jgi:uncharacterized DUF497 family protein
MLFDWDEANRRHIADHDVTPDEAEYVIVNNPRDIELQATDSEDRLVQVGSNSKGRVLVVVTTVRGPMIRVVTAYDATRSQRIAYERWRGESHGTET